MGLDEVPSWSHCPQGAAIKPASSRASLPFHTPSSKISYSLFHQNCWNKLILPVYSRSPFFLPIPRNLCRSLHSSLCLCFGLCDTGASFAATTGEIDQSSEGKGRRNPWVRKKGKSLLQTALYWERFNCSRLHWGADVVQLHWRLNRFFSVWQPNHICKIFSEKWFSHSKLSWKWTFLNQSAHLLC